MKPSAVHLSLGAFLAACLGLAAPARAVDPHPSFDRLVTSNGRAVVSYDRITGRIDTFLEHPFRFLEPADDPPDLCFSAVESRNLAYDTYFGVRSVPASGVRGDWLGEAPVDDARYVTGTGIIYTDQHVGEDRLLRARTWSFMPMGFGPAGAGDGGSGGQCRIGADARVHLLPVQLPAGGCRRRPHPQRRRGRGQLGSHPGDVLRVRSEPGHHRLRRPQRRHAPGRSPPVAPARTTACWPGLTWTTTAPRSLQPPMWRQASRGRRSCWPRAHPWTSPWPSSGPWTKTPRRTWMRCCPGPVAVRRLRW